MGKPGRPRVPLIVPADLIARYAAGELTIEGVAKAAGVGRDTVGRRIRKAGIDTSPKARARFSKAPRARFNRSKGQEKRLTFSADLLARYAAGELDHHALGKMLRASANLVLRELRRAGADTSRSTRKRLQRARRPEVNRREMTAVRLYAQGLTLAQVAQRLGVVKSSVRNFLRRRGVSCRRPQDYPQASGRNSKAETATGAKEAARRARVPSRVRKAPSPPNPSPAAVGRQAGQAQSPQRGKAPVAGLEEA
jgi:transposase